jgi:glycosyltransferase involved in cell wall biosynthesis
VERISSVPTGVDLPYFERPTGAALEHDLVFVGSMDWMPNIDGVRWFLDEVFPLIQAKKPGCRLAIVGRQPPASLVAEQNAHIIVTGTVPDVRPFLWHAPVSIVPLRIGGGTRLKIFEAMAAGTAVVSTTIGAEGLPVTHGETIRIADSAPEFAAECIELLENREACDRLAANALHLLRAKFSWERVTDSFERALEAAETPVSRTA